MNTEWEGRAEARSEFDSRRLTCEADENTVHRQNHVRGDGRQRGRNPCARPSKCDLAPRPLPIWLPSAGHAHPSHSRRLWVMEVVRISEFGPIVSILRPDVRSGGSHALRWADHSSSDASETGCELIRMLVRAHPTGALVVTRRAQPRPVERGLQGLGVVQRRPAVLADRRISRRELPRREDSCTRAVGAFCEVRVDRLGRLLGGLAEHSHRDVAEHRDVTDTEHRDVAEHRGALPALGARGHLLSLHSGAGPGARRAHLGPVSCFLLGVGCPHAAPGDRPAEHTRRASGRQQRRTAALLHGRPEISRVVVSFIF